MQDITMVPVALLKAAAEELTAGVVTDSNGTLDLPTSLVNELIDYFDEDLGCDHSVNICMCSTMEVVKSLRLSLEGKTECSTCHGDGAVYSKTQYNHELGRIAKERNLTLKEAAFYFGDDIGYAQCPTCGDSGVVVIPQPSPNGEHRYY